MEIPCPTCLTWSHYIQDKLERASDGGNHIVSLPIVLLKIKVNQISMNALLYFGAKMVTFVLYIHV